MLSEASKLKTIDGNYLFFKKKKRQEKEEREEIKIAKWI